MFKKTFKTVRLNRGYWHKKIPFFKYLIEDPLQVFSTDPIEFSKAMSSFKFSGVFKSTKADRHKETHKFLIQYLADLNDSPVILDIGASDGTTSLQLIERLDTVFKEYYVTDYNIKCEYRNTGKFTYFFDKSDHCFLVSSKKYSFFPENKVLFNLLFGKKLSMLRNKPKAELLLCNQYLKSKAESDEKIKIMSYNIFESWEMERPDIIIIGNLLNPIYFTKDKIYTGLLNCFNAMHEASILAIIRNSSVNMGPERELATFYKKNVAAGKFEQINQINGGIEINDFVLSSLFSKSPVVPDHLTVQERSGLS
jgi:hypothetical protein